MRTHPTSNEGFWIAITILEGEAGFRTNIPRKVEFPAALLWCGSPLPRAETCKGQSKADPKGPWTKLIPMLMQRRLVH